MGSIIIPEGSRTAAVKDFNSALNAYVKLVSEKKLTMLLPGGSAQNDGLPPATLEKMARNQILNLKNFSFSVLSNSVQTDRRLYSSLELTESRTRKTNPVVADSLKDQMSAVSLRIAACDFLLKSAPVAPAPTESVISAVSKIQPMGGAHATILKPRPPLPTIAPTSSAKTVPGQTSKTPAPKPQPAPKPVKHVPNPPAKTVPNSAPKTGPAGSKTKTEPKGPITKKGPEPAPKTGPALEPAQKTAPAVNDLVSLAATQAESLFRSDPELIHPARAVTLSNSQANILKARLLANDKNAVEAFITGKLKNSIEYSNSLINQISMDLQNKKISEAVASEITEEVTSLRAILLTVPPVDKIPTEFVALQRMRGKLVSSDSEANKAIAAITSLNDVKLSKAKTAYSQITEKLGFISKDIENEKKNIPDLVSKGKLSETLANELNGILDSYSNKLPSLTETIKNANFAELSQLADFTHTDNEITRLSEDVSGFKNAILKNAVETYEIVIASLTKYQERIDKILKGIDAIKKNAFLCGSDPTKQIKFETDNLKVIRSSFDSSITEAKAANLAAIQEIQDSLLKNTHASATKKILETIESSEAKVSLCSKIGNTLSLAVHINEMIAENKFDGKASPERLAQISTELNKARAELESILPKIEITTKQDLMRMGTEMVSENGELAPILKVVKNVALELKIGRKTVILRPVPKPGEGAPSGNDTVLDETATLKQEIAQSLQASLKDIENLLKELTHALAAGPSKRLGNGQANEIRSLLNQERDKAVPLSKRDLSTDTLGDLQAIKTTADEITNAVSKAQQNTKTSSETYVFLSRKTITPKMRSASDSWKAFLDQKKQGLICEGVYNELYNCLKPNYTILTTALKNLDSFGIAEIDKLKSDYGSSLGDIFKGIKGLDEFEKRMKKALDEYGELKTAIDNGNADIISLRGEIPATASNSQELNRLLKEAEDRLESSLTQLNEADCNRLSAMATNYQRSIGNIVLAVSKISEVREALTGNPPPAPSQQRGRRRGLVDSDTKRTPQVPPPPPDEDTMTGASPLPTTNQALKKFTIPKKMPIKKVPGSADKKT